MILALATQMKTSWHLFLGEGRVRVAQAFGLDTAAEALFFDDRPLAT